MIWLIDVRTRPENRLKLDRSSRTRYQGLMYHQLTFTRDSGVIPRAGWFELCKVENHGKNPNVELGLARRAKQ